MLLWSRAAQSRETEIENTHATVVVDPPLPMIDLSLSKTVDDPNPTVGSSVEFEIVVSNVAGGTLVSATVGDWTWDSSSMYFHAGWRGQYPVPTRPYSDWNYVTLKGRGVYVGDTLTIPAGS